jgi:hypothetical protein
MVDDNLQLVWFLGLLQELGHSGFHRILHYPTPDYSYVLPKIDCWRRDLENGDENNGVSGAVSCSGCQT